VLTALLWRLHNAATGQVPTSTVYEAIRALEQVGVLSWLNRIKRVREYVQPAATKVRGAASRRQRFQSVGPGEARRQGGECGSGQIKPREPGRPQPDATTFRGSASFAISPGR
jgi:hypothetical protein